MVPVQLGRYCCCKLWSPLGDKVLRKEIGVADVTFERISKWKLLPRFMMLIMTLMSWRCAEWFMNLDAPTAAQSAFVSVVMGAMTGAFGIWMGGENRGHRNEV